MDITLTQAQIDHIREMWDAGPNAQGNYSDIYSYVASLLPLGSDERNWFLGAAQANAGQGAYSSLIREYTKRQMELRGIGDLYSSNLMQEASNRVAERAITDILDLTRINDDGTWSFPSMADIASNDAIGVGEILFDWLPSGDTARSGIDSDGGFNAAWSGTILFSALNASQTWRLTNSGGINFNTLDDAKNILFAYDALASGMISAKLATAYNYVFDRMQFWTDGLIGLSTWWKSTTVQWTHPSRQKSV